MCGRLTVLTTKEVEAVADALRTQLGETAPEVMQPKADAPLGATLHADPRAGSREQGRPGSALHAFALHEGELALPQLSWGIEAPWNKRLVINTRIESALGLGRRASSFWQDALQSGRCILPAASFFEPHMTETLRNPRTGRSSKRSYEFASPAGTPLLLAALQTDGHFSIVTTEPNAAVAPIHPRMPLILRFEEAPLWLAGEPRELSALADRSAIALESWPEEPGTPSPSSEGARKANSQGMQESMREDGQLSLF